MAKRTRAISSGVPQMQRKIRSVMSKFPSKVAAALYVEANIEMTESKRRVPVDTGTLRASGFVSQPVRGRGRSISVDLSFGGAAERYAEIVHEDLEAYHPIGQAKYLESVLNESAPHMGARLARRLNIEKP